MNCSDVRHLIHLDVGDDLRAEEEQQLAAHMEGCSDCRVYHSGMSCAMSALMVLRNAPSADAEQVASKQSAWPAISREIRKRQSSPIKTRTFNLQVAALSVCSLSLAVVTMVQSLSSMRGSMDAADYVPAQSVSHSGQMSAPNYPQFPQYNAPRGSEPRNVFLPASPPSSNASAQSF